MMSLAKYFFFLISYGSQNVWKFFWILYTLPNNFIFMVKMAKKPRKKRASGADFKIQCLTLVSVTFCKITVPMRGYTHYPVGLIDPTCIRSGRVTEGGPPTGKPGGGVDNLRQAGGGGTPSPTRSLSGSWIFKSIVPRLRLFLYKT